MSQTQHPRTGLAPAKINLTLHVTGQRGDGYHLLDSVVVFADLGDTITLTPGPDLALTVDGPFADGVPIDARNLVWRAALAAGWRGHIQLTKTLPHAAGIGSGSSDAATVLRLLNADLSRDQILALGADVPVCLPAAASRMAGIGQQVTPISLPPMAALLVNPGTEVPTGAVFQGLAHKQNPPMPATIPTFADAPECARWIASQRNDLEPPARAVAPAIAEVLHLLGATRDVLLARMSGSGATCFALYPTMQAAHLAAYDIGAAQPDWWCVATTLG